jgi:arsenite/tail-anchored protein-transporting ATPase
MKNYHNLFHIVLYTTALQLQLQQSVSFQPMCISQTERWQNLYRHEHNRHCSSVKQQSISSSLSPRWNKFPQSLFSTTTKSSTTLRSMQKLVDDVITTSGRTIFVGGKGGVGKTTVSSAIAVNLASSIDKNILIVSTDPAHSLGDALDIDLRSSKGQPIQLTDPLTNGKLYACEVDASAALDEFRSNLQAFDVAKLADALGVSPDLLSNLGLQEFSNLLNNPPPGLDELVALSNVLDRSSSQQQFDTIIVDTAPTGHTLRLLALPQFLDGLLGKLIQLRMKLSGIASTLQTFFGAGDQQAAKQRTHTIDTALSKLETFRTKMSKLRTTLQNPAITSFVVVTVPTKLGIAESKRLVTELSSQNVRVSDIVVNQCVVLDEDDTVETNNALFQYYQRRQSGQSKWITNLQETVTKVSASSEYKNNGNDDKPISISKVPFFDVELVGIPALGYVGSQIYYNNPSFTHLLDVTKDDANLPPKVVICGGKGGVGKTTTSSSLAITMAAAGHKVALISTDPAHSLGDAVDMNLKGGNLQDCTLIGVPHNTGDGSLSVLEIDPTKAISSFKGLVDQLIGSNTVAGTNGLTDTLRDLQEVFDTLPAGTDEVVALARIVKFVKEGKYDRIVLDTAPTGHTLRMLSTPGFLADLIERLLVIADKVNTNPAIRMLVAASSGGKSDELSAAAAQARSTLLSFQFQMYDLEDMFSNAEQTEFLIVTIPTELAVRESVRLLNDLTYESPDMPIKVRNIVINQVLDDDSNQNNVQTFLSHLQTTQKGSIEELNRYVQTNKSVSGPPPIVTNVRYLDTEPRGVFGLKVLAAELLRQEEVAEIVT